VAVSEGQTDGKEDTKSASTIVKLLSSNERFALLQLNPTTGRKHQLRLVCSEILHAPIVGDFKYGYKGDKVGGHLLHCFELQFQVRQVHAFDFSSHPRRLVESVPFTTLSPDMAEERQTRAHHGAGSYTRQHA
jgi:23S rRNA-/tRNA-specific pseudouridylate synthase